MKTPLSNSEPTDPEYEDLKAQLCRNWGENRPREFASLKRKGQFQEQLTSRALSIWELYETMRQQGSDYGQAMEVLRDCVAPALEDDHPFALMDLCDDLDQFDSLVDDRKEALRAGGKKLAAWDNKIAEMRRRRNFY